MVYVLEGGIFSYLFLMWNQLPVFDVEPTFWAVISFFQRSAGDVPDLVLVDWDTGELLGWI